ncbi:hypothetical protein AGMMS49545_18100 [Betaproteobacteria bacterium]|nr:hypothetical protein AGMMS49545_18100 [Betaproteobacteria bacterium]GHU45187.1 hypothetical protein AGMMS50289_15730 [Betaproteobacteria bacterium]
MKAITLHCPECGGDSSVKSQKAKTKNITLSQFTCDNPKCRCSFFGETILTRASIPEMETFTAGSNNGGIKTDC